MVVASSVTAQLVSSFADVHALLALTEDMHAVVIGPAAGVTEATRANVEALAKADRTLVLDAIEAVEVFARTQLAYHFAHEHGPFSYHDPKCFPNLVPDRPDAGGAALSRRARDVWSQQWSGQSFMAVGMKDPVLGPPVMNGLRQVIRNCPPPLELPDAGHFVQEAGEVIVVEALKSFGPMR
jgi:pimeloyl-ACP methyl ester carboxylesterase